MNVDSYWADEDDLDDEFCYREISPFDDSAASFALNSFTTAARTSHIDNTPEHTSMLQADLAELREAATRVNVGTTHDKSELGYNTHRPMWKVFARTPEDTACVVCGAIVVHGTDKALLITCDALNAPAWVPKSVVISYTPLTLPGWFVQKMLDTDIAQKQGDFEGLCPYCGGQHCDCGTDI